MNESFLQRQEQLSKPVTLDINANNNLDDQKIEGNPNDLLRAMNKVLRRLQLAKPIETKVTTKEISTEDRILQIKSRLSDLPKTFDFNTLTSDCHNLQEYVATFLAILVMAKDHVLVFNVDENDDIWFKKGSEL